MISYILNFLFPRYCILCDKRLTTQEQHLCVPCYMHLPRTLYHTTEHSPIEKLFWGIIPIERAVSFFHYSESNKNLLLQLKYKNNTDVGFYLASQFAKEIGDSGFFDNIDIIIPVPLHWKRRMYRGYNQSEFIARGISSITQIPVCTDAVKRKINNVSQTKLPYNERKQNVDNIFCVVRPERLVSKHILMVDDVTTSGSTIKSLAQEIARIKDVKISVLTLAVASQTKIPIFDGHVVPTTSINVDTLSKLK